MNPLIQQLIENVRDLYIHEHHGLLYNEQIVYDCANNQFVNSCAYDSHSSSEQHVIHPDVQPIIAALMSSSTVFRIYDSILTLYSRHRLLSICLSKSMPILNRPLMDERHAQHFTNAPFKISMIRQCMYAHQHTNLLYIETRTHAADPVLWQFIIKLPAMYVIEHADCRKFTGLIIVRNTTTAEHYYIVNYNPDRFTFYKAHVNVVYRNSGLYSAVDGKQIYVSREHEVVVPIEFIH